MVFFRNYSDNVRDYLSQINQMVQSSWDHYRSLDYHDAGDFLSALDDGKSEIASVIQRILNDNTLTTPEKLFLASRQYDFYDGKFCCFIDNEATDDALIASFLDEILKSKEPLPKETIRILRNDKFINRLTKDDLVFRYIDTLKKLPIHVCLPILNDHVIDKLSHYAATHQTEYNDTIKELIEALLFKSEQPSQRYKINMMRMKEMPSAPEMLPEALMTLNNDLPLANVVLEAINIRRHLGYGRPDLPEYLVDYINESIQFYSHPGFSWLQDFTFTAGIKQIFSWLFSKQENLNKSLFLTNLMTDIYRNPNKPYSDCVDDAKQSLTFNAMGDSRIARIIDKLYLSDMPVAMVQTDVSNAEADIYEKSELNQASIITLAPRQGF